MMQPPSRRLIALRWCAAKTRSLMSIPRMRPDVSVVTRCTAPMHATCRATASDTGSSHPSRCACPRPDCRSRASADTTRVGAAPPIVGSSPERAATPRIIASASCCFIARERWIGRGGHGAVLVRVDEMRPRRVVRPGPLRIQDAVEQPRKLGGDLRQRVPAQRHDPVAADAHREPPLAHCSRLARLGAVLIEVHRPHLRLQPKFVSARNGTAPFAASASRGRQFGVGSRPSVAPACRGIERADDCHQRIQPDRAFSAASRIAGYSAARTSPVDVEIGCRMALAPRSTSPTVRPEACVVRCTSSFIERHP